MYQKLAEVTLNDGRRAEAGVVVAPDLEWSGPLERFLAHQDELWQWQNREVLRGDVGVDVYFYVLHRGGRLVSSMMSAERHGVGLRGHVWTPPAERRNGACSSLQAAQLEHFRSRGGRSLALYTDYNSVAFNIYRRVGFREVEPLDGHMQYHSLPPGEFENEYFVKSEAAIEPLGWRHWPTAVPLFMGRFPGHVRCAPLGLVGRRSSEYALLQEIRRCHNGGESKDPRVMVLRSEATEAVVGLAAWRWHPRESGACLIDVFCHPHYWDEADNLLASLPLPRARRYVCYADSSYDPKVPCLRNQGFLQAAHWPGFPVDLCRVPLARLPRSRMGGRLIRTGWALARLVDAPLSGCWRGLVGASGARARVPAKWPRFPVTHGLRVDLTLYEKNCAS